MAGASMSIEGDTLRLTGVLDFETVVGLDTQGREWLQGPAPAQCFIDLAAISYCSSVGVALVLGWLRCAQQQQKHLNVRHMPADMLALAQVGGLETILSAA